MLGELIPKGGGDSIPLLNSRLLVGRRSRCDICLDFPNVSSQHCELELTDGYWQVRDLGSTNGIKVNGLRVDVQVLMPGDELTVARHEFELNYQPLTEGPAPEVGDADPFSRSLLEKAGLEGRRRERRRAERHVKKKTSSVPNADGDENQEDTQILDWLTEEDVAG
ncbi:MAG: forkhead-associated protein [Planctomycetaceae bacterium]|jgi:adenylate cyclase|nr:forkhead-associated protein [Planctomycetaceae bacterium]MDP7275117.1 FHA domain-containing protein [Planctomycetaceae bacterium]